MAKGRGNKVNRAELASVFGVSLPTIDAWVRAGCPFDERGAGKGKAWVFDTADVAAWRELRARDEAGGADLQDEQALRRRKLAAETALSELELAKAQNLVAPIEQMEKNLAPVFAAITANMRNIPSRVATLLIGETDERKFKATLLAEIDLVLENLASLDLAAEADEDDDELTDEDA